MTDVEVRDRGKQYGFRVSPMLSGDMELVLCTSSDGGNALGTGSLASELLVEKKTLEELSVAYLYLRDKDGIGTRVRIFTRPPELCRIFLRDGGLLELVLAPKCSFESMAGLEVVFGETEDDERSLRLPRGEWSFSLGKAGIVYTEAGNPWMSICYQVKNENGVMIFGPPARGRLIVQAPGIKKLTWNRGEGIDLQLEREPTGALLARILQAGQDCLGILSCQGKGEQWFLPMDSFNLFGEGYALVLGCRGEWGDSYWTEPLAITTAVPQIASCRKGETGWDVRMKEAGFYACGETCFLGDQFTSKGEELPQIRFAQQGERFLSLGPAAVFTQKQERGFICKNSRYRRRGVSEELLLSEDYRAFDNASFGLREENGHWRIVYKGDEHADPAADFRELLLSQADTYARCEELRTAVCRWPLAAEEMLLIRYGYNPAQGCCDIAAGMLLHLGYRQYQNIPEERGETAEEPECLSDRNLSGFTGNGTITYHAVIREGTIVFEPFAAETVKLGGMEVSPCQIGEEGRICPGSGIYNMLGEQSRGPFLRMMYPSVWKESGHLDHGSMFYFDQLCLISANSYRELEEASERYRKRRPPLPQAAYLTFRGKTEGRLMIQVFVEGHPQSLPLGATVADVTAAYGMGAQICLERMTEEGYLPFLSAGDDIPLFVGDRIWHR